MSSGDPTIPTNEGPIPLTPDIIRAIVFQLFGISYISATITAVLWGLSVAQFYHYTINYWNNDSPYLKMLVVVVFVLATTHQVMRSASSFDQVVTHWGDIPYLDFANLIGRLEVIVLGVLIFLVQSYMVYRIWRFSQNVLLSFALFLIVCGGLTSEIFYFSKTVFMSRFDQYPSVFVASMITNSLNLAADLALTTSMCYYLIKAKAGLKRTTKMVNKCVIFTINSGALTSACALGALISLAANGPPNLFSLFYYVGARLYVNSLLGILNGRSSLRSALRQEHSTPHIWNSNANGPSSLTRSIPVRIGPVDDEEGDHSDYRLHAYKSAER